MSQTTVPDLPSFKTNGAHSISGLSSGAFMTVQMSVAHSSTFMGAGVVAGGPYRSAETFPRAAPSASTACILNSLYVAMTPLTEFTAPDVDALIALARGTPRIDDLSHVARQRVYIFTGRSDKVVNQFVVRKTRDFYARLGVAADALKFVDDVDAGHCLVTSNPDDTRPLSENRPPYINYGGFMLSHEILRHIYPDLREPTAARGELRLFRQAEFVAGRPDGAGLSEYAYLYVPSAVAAGAPARGVHVVMHGCKQGYEFQDFAGGLRNRDEAPYGARYVTRTGYLEAAEANDLLLLFPQVAGTDDNLFQNPDGCWDWWGYASENPDAPDYYTQDAAQIRAIHAMLDRLAGG